VPVLGKKTAYKQEHWIMAHHRKAEKIVCGHPDHNNVVIAK
jgi:hypothetical protein